VLCQAPGVPDHDSPRDRLTVSSTTTKPALVSRTMETVPEDRARTKVGVGEDVLVRIQPEESVTWSVTGGGSVKPTSAPATCFTAGDRAGTSTVKATRNDGSTLTLTFTVIEPSGGRVERKPGTGVWHEKGKPSVGILGEFYLLPEDVSFKAILFREGVTHAKCTGYFKPKNGWAHDPSPEWLSIVELVPGKGWKVDGSDRIFGTDDWIGKPYADGTFLWTIPWQFRVGKGNPKVFTSVDQLKTIDPSGALTVTKGNASATKALNDPSTTIGDRGPSKQ
jgi:hypothetical protein